jgi:hypothetical protein
MTQNVTAHRDSKAPLVKRAPVRLSQEELQIIEYYENKENRSRSSVIRRMFILGIEQYKRNNPL